MWENGEIEGSQFLGSVWQPQRTIKLQPKEIEIYDNLINNALCMTPFSTMLKHNTFRDRIQMTADIFEPVMLCFIKEMIAHLIFIDSSWVHVLVCASLVPLMYKARVLQGKRVAILRPRGNTWDPSLVHCSGDCCFTGVLPGYWRWLESCFWKGQWWFMVYFWSWVKEICFMIPDLFREVAFL